MEFSYKNFDTGFIAYEQSQNNLGRCNVIGITLGALSMNMLAFI